MILRSIGKWVILQARWSGHTGVGHQHEGAFCFLTLGDRTYDARGVCYYCREEAPLQLLEDYMLLSMAVRSPLHERALVKKVLYDRKVMRKILERERKPRRNG
jgi:hypothetical protein